MILYVILFSVLYFGSRGAEVFEEIIFEFEKFFNKWKMIAESNVQDIEYVTLNINFLTRK